MLVDSSVVIDWCNGSPAAAAFAGVSPSSTWMLHPVVEVEILAGARNRGELRRFAATLDHLAPARVAPADFDHCRAFVKRHTLSHGLGWPDCLIAATALRLGVPVATINDKHFRIIRGLKVIRPY